MTNRLRRTGGSGLEAKPRSSQREVGRVSPRGRGCVQGSVHRVGALLCDAALAGRWRARGCEAACASARARWCKLIARGWWCAGPRGGHGGPFCNPRRVFATSSLFRQPQQAHRAPPTYPTIACVAANGARVSGRNVRVSPCKVYLSPRCCISADQSPRLWRSHSVVLRP